MGRFVKATAFAGVLLLGSGIQADTGTEDAAVDRLRSEILATIASVPGTSNVNGFEGQISLTIDQRGESCPVVQRAIATSQGQSGVAAADRALRALSMVYARCAREGGTGSVGSGGSSAFTYAPGFSVGAGSSNYSQ